MKLIAIVLFKDVLMLDVAGPMEVFSIANRYLPPDDHYRITTISADERTVMASNGIQMLADYTIHDAPLPFDLLLVPGGPGAYNNENPELAQWLRMAVQQCPHYGSICTGAFILGEAGLLDGKQVTTHWHYIDRLARRCPHAQVKGDHIYIQDQGLLTSGGVTAGIDMALAILADDHGREVAVSVAKVLLVVMRRQGGQAQFSPMTAAVGKDESPIAQVQNYVLQNIDEEFTVERMASLVAMSTRNFARVFTREVNMTPMEFVHSARIDHARVLLENQDIPLKTVAFRSGFGSVKHMRLLFCERLGLTPAQYRHQFG